MTRVRVLAVATIVALLVATIVHSVDAGAAPALTAPVPTVVGDQIVDSSGTPIRLDGVDASGTEDACVLGRGFSWGPMDQAEAASIASWHATAVRVPLNEDCWLGINGVPAQFSGAAYRSAIQNWVSTLNAAGLVAILDLHWSAPGTIESVGQWPMADTGHAIPFWSQVASTFKDQRSVIFDLFNEPFQGRSTPAASDWACWRNGCNATAPNCPPPTSPTCSTTVTYHVAGMQQLVDTVRGAGASQPIMVGGLNWSGDPCGTKDVGHVTGTCSWLQYEPVDPDRQLIASFHTYNWTACKNVTCWNQSVAPVAAVVPVVTGELGERGCSSAYVSRYMNWADQHGVSYLAWSWQPFVAGASCRGAGLRLLSDWSGAPSTANPVGQVFLGHLSDLAG